MVAQPLAREEPIATGLMAARGAGAVRAPGSLEVRAPRGVGCQHAVEADQEQPRPWHRASDRVAIEAREAFHRAVHKATDDSATGMPNSVSGR